MLTICICIRKSGNYVFYTHAHTTHHTPQLIVTGCVCAYYSNWKDIFRGYPNWQEPINKKASTHLRRYQHVGRQFTWLAFVHEVQVMAGQLFIFNKALLILWCLYNNTINSNDFALYTSFSCFSVEFLAWSAHIIPQTLSSLFVGSRTTSLHHTIPVTTCWMPLALAAFQCISLSTFYVSVSCYLQGKLYWQQH